MSLKAIQWVWDSSRSEGNDRLVFLALADYADGNGEAWPHQDLVSAKCHLSRRTVQRAIEALVELGELRVLRTGRGNRYQMVMRQSDVIRQSDASDASIWRQPSDNRDASDASTVAHRMNHQEPSMNLGRSDASLEKSKAGDRPAQPTWVRPSNFFEDLDQLPENQVEPITEETKAAALERLRLLKGGQA